MLPYQNDNNDFTKGVLFAIAIIVFLCFLVVNYFLNNNVILGTELNSDGTVEYMCLGSGCENIHNFKWSDK